MCEAIEKKIEILMTEKIKMSEDFVSKIPEFNFGNVKN